VNPENKATPAGAAVIPPGADAAVDVYAVIVSMAPFSKTHTAPRAAAVLATRIRSMGAAAIDPLIRASRHPDETVRVNAFRLLSFLRDRRVTDRMFEALRSEEPLLAMYAIQKLVGDGDRRVLAPLRKHVLWLERLTATAPRMFSPQYTTYCLNRYFLVDARDALECLNCRLAKVAAG
jgi:hypothetical protein